MSTNSNANATGAPQSSVTHPMLLPEILEVVTAEFAFIDSRSLVPLSLVSKNFQIIT